MNNRLIPCLWLDDQAEAAAAFYTRVFPDGRIVARSYYPESFDCPGGRPRGSLLTVEFEIAGQRFTALNGGPMFVINPSISFFVHAADAEEATRLFAALQEGGAILMPLDAYPWSECYGWVQDRFGVSWQVITGRRAAQGPRIAPCLMFAGEQRGNAASALRQYERIFPDTHLDDLRRYEPGEGPAGQVKHGRLAVGEQDLLAMDSHVDHDVAFSEAVSLQVMCADQQEVDRYWAALSEGGAAGPCGWLKDRYGVSWQVVPQDITQWLECDDVAARDRAFQAMMSMGKLDIAALQKAFRGE